MVAAVASAAAIDPVASMHRGVVAATKLVQYQGEAAVGCRTVGLVW